ncbi:MAG: 1-acyl-sn-glycerol-3-phosphate acyltransferase [Clostridia bacterium]|nr:1-acyl-sn-glycerol-3-phosphate acyltransferase [Clostridia bacterium]
MKSKNRKPNDFSLFHYLFYDCTKVLTALPGLIWFRPKYLYVNDKAKKRIRGGAIVISNHNSFFDPVYLQFAVWYRRHHFVCLQKFFDGPAGWLFKCFLCIPVDKENVSLDSFRSITDCLEKGELVTIFPEGKVDVAGEEISAFRTGMVLMAMTGGAPIVPVYIKKRKRFYDRLVAVFGEAVDIGAVFADEPAFTRIEKIAKMLEEKEQELKQFSEEHTNGKRST